MLNLHLEKMIIYVDRGSDSPCLQFSVLNLQLQQIITRRVVKGNEYYVIY